MHLFLLILPLLAGTSGSDMSGLFTGVSGSITAECDPPSTPGATSQACTISLSGLPIDKVSLECSSSECYDPKAIFGGAGLTGA